MASAGGSGSRSSNQSFSQFNQKLSKDQLPYLKDLWNNAYNVGRVTLDNTQAQIPGVINNQNAAFNSAMNGVNNLQNGGAYAGVNGSDVASGINSQMQTLNSISNPQMQTLNSIANPQMHTLNPISAGPNSMIAMPGAVGDLQDLPSYYNSQNLPGSIQTSQSSILDQLNPTASTSNRLLNQSRLINQNTNPNQPSNTQEIYDQMMGGHGNTYADAMAGTVQRQANIAQKNALNNIDQRAALAGMSGSSRQGVAQANAIKDINQNLQDNLAQIGYSTFDKDLSNKLDIAKQADSNNLQRYLGNQNYNMGLINAGNTQAQNAQNYNLGLAGAANTNNSQNLNYNLGLGNNTNSFNANSQNYNLGYGNNVNTANNNRMNYNLGMNQNATNYNLGMANSNNVNQQNQQNYNLGLAGANNTNQQNQQNYNLGLAGANNTNQQNQQNYNLGLAGANNTNQQNQQNYNLGLAGNNTALQSLLGNLVSGNQASQVAGLQAAPTVQNMAGAPLQTVNAPWQSMSSWADTIGGPIVLGRGSSMGQGSSKGGGGGVSVGSMG